MGTGQGRCGAERKEGVSGGKIKKDEARKKEKKRKRWREGNKQFNPESLVKKAELKDHSDLLQLGSFLHGFVHHLYQL